MGAHSQADKLDWTKDINEARDKQMEIEGMFPYILFLTISRSQNDFPVAEEGGGEKTAREDEINKSRVITRYGGAQCLKFWYVGNHYHVHSIRNGENYDGVTETTKSQLDEKGR